MQASLLILNSATVLPIQNLCRFFIFEEGDRMFVTECHCGSSCVDRMDDIVRYLVVAIRFVTC